MRIRYAGFLTCTRAEKDTVFCKWSPPSAELKVKGTIHWVQLDQGNDDHDHLISPEERLRVAMLRQ